jgi:hypothetical protein
MKAKIDEIFYLPGQHSMIQDFKSGQRTKSRGGRVYKATGSGWGKNIESGKIFVIISVNDNQIQLRVDPYFRNRLNDTSKTGRSRLTDNRVKAIIEAQPKSVTLEYFQDYWRVTSADLKAWYDRAVVNF